MSTRSAFSLTKTLSAAVEFLPAALAGAWLILLLMAGLSVAPVLLHHGMHAPVVRLVALLAGIVIKLVLVGALYRLALFGKDARKEGLGLGGVQFGAPELRLFVANIVVVLFLVLIAIALFIVFSIAFETSGLGEGYANTREAVTALLRAHDSPAAWAVIAYLAAAAWFLVFVALKFCLVHAATIAEKKIVTLNALGLSSGNVAKLFFGQLILLLPFILIGLFLMHLFGHAILHHTGGMAGVHLAFHAALAVLLPPLFAGFLASAYRQITANRSK